MRNKIIISIISFVLLSVISISCKKDFLELKSQQSTDASVAIKDIQSLRAAINGVYNLLQSYTYYGRNTTLIPDLMSDNDYVSTQNAGRYLDYDRYTVTKSSSYAKEIWDQVYQVIVNCNFIIDKGTPLQLPTSDQDEQSAIIGEAYTIRALAHFDLCRLYALPYNATADASHPGIPVITKSSTSIEDLVKPSRNTVKEVYDAVIADLQKAINLLPETLPGKSSSYKGMVAQNAAKALLSRVYLYKEDWTNAAQMATDVIESKQYELLDGASLVTEFGTPDNDETIFEIQYSEIDNQGTSSLAYMYNQKGYGDILATKDLYNQYGTNDVRKGFMQMGNRNAKGGEKNVPLVVKYNNTANIYSANIKVIRLAEVYLNRAEAYAHSGQDPLALIDLEKIAQRSEPGVVLDPLLSGQALIDRILLERRKELAFEGNRLFDLTRNKLGFTKYLSGTTTIDVTYPSQKTILPIPEAETDVNPNVTQNDGY